MPKKLLITVDGFGADRVISDIQFLTNRMSFLNATKKALNAMQPEHAKGALTVKSGIDRRHWESNEMIKREIEQMFKGQKFDDVAQHFYGNFSNRVYNYPGRIPLKSVPETSEQLENALYHYWRMRFSDTTNLRLGASEPNQTLGRLIGTLKKRVEAMGEGKFKPFSFQYCDEDGNAFTVNVDTPQDLYEWYWNANFDFLFDGQMEEELAEAEDIFRYAVNAPEIAGIGAPGPEGDPGTPDAPAEPAVASASGSSELAADLGEASSLGEDLLEVALL